jgi:hypothetical protein
VNKNSFRKNRRSQAAAEMKLLTAVEFMLRFGKI